MAISKTADAQRLAPGTRGAGAAAARKESASGTLQQAHHWRRRHIEHVLCAAGEPLPRSERPQCAAARQKCAGRNGAAACVLQRAPVNNITLKRWGIRQHKVAFASWFSCAHLVCNLWVLHLLRIILDFGTENQQWRQRNICASRRHGACTRRESSAGTAQSSAGRRPAADCPRKLHA